MTVFKSPTSKLLVEENGHILIMRINRPEAHNAIDIDMLTALSNCYTYLGNTQQLRCGILCSEGDSFSSGLDLPTALPRMVADGSRSYLADGQCDPLALFGSPCPKPVIVAVHGLCYTAGLELTLAADICVAARDTVFRQHEVTRGIFPFGGATFRLPQIIGWHSAMRYILTGESFDADEAYCFGLVQHLSEPGRQLQDAIALAERICRCAPLGVQAAMANARLYMDKGKAATVADLETSGRRIAATEDAMGGSLDFRAAPGCVHWPLKCYVLRGDMRPYTARMKFARERPIHGCCHPRT